MRSKSLLLSILVAAAQVIARCGHDITERGLASHLARKEALELQKRQGTALNLTTQEQLLDPAQECTIYYYAPVANILNQFPSVWQIASIVPGDTEATNAYNSIISDAQFPTSILPKGLPDGNFTGVNYTSEDPDCWWSWAKCVTPKHPGILQDIYTCPEPSTWGLTYDDGPNCTHNAFYNFLQQQKQTATMFFIGSNVVDWPLQAQRALADGHQIGVHTWSHRYMTALSNEQVFAELWYSRKAIKSVLDVTPLYWRPPFGDVDDRVRFIASKMNLTNVLWDIDTFDWRVASESNPAGIPTASVLANYDTALTGDYSREGIIVLSHELNNATMGLAIMEYPNITSRFAHVVPVATCQNITHPYVEQNFAYPSFNEWVAGNRSTTNNSVALQQETAVSSAAKRKARRKVL